MSPATTWPPCPSLVLYSVFAAGLPLQYAVVQCSARPQEAARRGVVVITFGTALPEQQAGDLDRRGGGFGREEVDDDERVRAVFHAGVGARSAPRQNWMLKNGLLPPTVLHTGGIYSRNVSCDEDHGHSKLRG